MYRDVRTSSEPGMAGDDETTGMYEHHRSQGWREMMKIQGCTNIIGARDKREIIPE